MRNFLKNHRRETIIFLICFTAKILAFLIIIGLRLKFGDFEFINKVAEPSDKIFRGGVPTFNFYEPGGWHPPLYYFFTASILSIFPYEWIIFLIQDLLVSISAVLVYKIGLIIFIPHLSQSNQNYFEKGEGFNSVNNGEKISFWSAILFGIEPYLSFETNTLGSDILGLFFFTFFLYFFIKYLKIGALKNIIASSVFLSFATLTRPSTLYLPVIIFFFLVVFWIFMRRPALKILKHFLIFIAVFLLFIVPWMLVNKVSYGEFVFSRLSKVNFYPYNAATFIAAKEKISFGEARARLEEKARQETEKTGEPLDDYYSREARKIIFSDPAFYAKLHLIKSVPFLLQPGYEIMMHGYGIPYKPDRPDLTLLFMQRNFSAILKFITSIDIATALYLAGLLFWVILNILLIAAFIKSFRHSKFTSHLSLKFNNLEENQQDYIKKGEGFIFLIFLFFILIIIYHALLYGTIAIARYRLPMYFMFFMPAFYIIFTRKKLSAEN